MVEPGSHSPPRFTLRTLFAVTTSLAIWCAFVAIVPFWMSQMLIGFIWIVAASAVVIGIVYARGTRQTFCIGASIVLASMWTGPGGQLIEGFQQMVELLLGPLQLPRAVEGWTNIAILGGLAAGNGWFAIKARRYFEAASPDADD